MALSLITPPTAYPVTLDEVKNHLRVDGVQEDSLLLGLIAAVTGHLDGANGLLGRAIITQAWLQTEPHFEAEIRLSVLDVQEITSLSYLDESGAWVDLAADAYGLTTDGYLAPAFGGRWPTTARAREAVKIRYVAGYGDPAAVPPALKSAILLHIGHLYRCREAVGEEMSELPLGYADLINPYRVLWL